RFSRDWSSDVCSSDLGTTGESPTLSQSEYRELVQAAVRFGHEANLLVIAGTGSNSTAHAVESQRFAHEAGADGALSVNPYYNKRSEERRVGNDCKSRC